MGSINIFKLLSTVLSSAVIKSQQLREKNSSECQELTPGSLVAKQDFYPLRCATPGLGNLYKKIKQDTQMSAKGK